MINIDRLRSLQKDISNIRSSFSGSLPEQDDEIIREFIYVGEYKLALETICGWLTEENIAVSGNVKQQIVELATQMEVDQRFWSSIKTVE